MTQTNHDRISRRTALKAMGGISAISAAALAAPAIVRAASAALPKPDFARNMHMIGHTDMSGRPDGVQVMINKSHAFVGHIFSNGFSVIDVTDPRSPRPVNFIAAPPDTWTPGGRAGSPRSHGVAVEDSWRWPDTTIQDAFS